MGPRGEGGGCGTYLMKAPVVVLKTCNRPRWTQRRRSLSAVSTSHHRDHPLSPIQRQLLLPLSSSPYCRPGTDLNPPVVGVGDEEQAVAHRQARRLVELAVALAIPATPHHMTTSDAHAPTEPERAGCGRGYRQTEQLREEPPTT